MKITKLIQNFSIGRSGHNAINSWLIKQSEVETGPIDISYEQTLRTTCGPNYIGAWSNHNCATGPLPQYKVSSMLPTNKKYDLFIVSYENWRGHDFSPPTSFSIGENITTNKTTFIMRDVFNWAASIVKGNSKGQFVKMYCEHARYCIENKKSIDCIILFNSWFQSVEYRKEICKILDLNFNDSGYNDRPRNSGGESSFKNTGDLDVLNRWKHMIGNAFYKEFFTEEILYYNSILFPDTKDIINKI